MVFKVDLAHVLQNGSNTKLSAPFQRHNLLELFASPYPAPFYVLREIWFVTTTGRLFKPIHPKRMWMLSSAAEIAGWKC